MDSVPGIGPLGNAAIAAGIAAGNINTAVPAERREMMDLSDQARAGQAEHEKLMVVLEVKRRARFYPAPTDQEEVKQKLRELGHPITLFGEGPADRRDRLKFLLAQAEVERQVAEQGVAAVTAAVQGDARAAALASAGIAGPAGAGASVSAPSGAEKAELFYTPGSPALVQARKAIAGYSFKAAQSRLAAQAAAASDPAIAAAEDAHAVQVYRTLKRMRPCLSQVADERPLSACALSTDGSLLAVGSWGGTVRLWNPATGVQYASLKGHRERIVGVAWHPSAGLGLGGAADSTGSWGAGLLVSASADCTARLWRVPVDTLRDAALFSPDGLSGLAALSRQSKGRRGGTLSSPLAGAGAGAGAGASSSGDVDMDGGTQPSAERQAFVNGELERLRTNGLTDCAILSGHAARLSSVAFHPSGDYVGTTSYDKTWRLWDVRTGVSIKDSSSGGSSSSSANAPSELLLQEGHAKEVYPIAFHPDGALVATGDLSGLGRVWDLRSGKSIFLLRGHTKQLLALDWSPNGTTLASGSDDNSCCVWDVRQQRTLYTIPAHGSLISKVKFAPVSGEYLLTASFDGLIKAWSARDWSPLGSLAGRDGKVTSLDVYHGDEAHVVSVGFDRTFKTWAHEIEF